MNDQQPALPGDIVPARSKRRRRGVFVFTDAGHRVQEESAHVHRFTAHDVDVRAEVIPESLYIHIGEWDISVFAEPPVWWNPWGRPRLIVAANVRR